ncbi:MAG: hypothetical protein WC748_02040 [Legionellales bacterium]|jgi:hypothetical protein
MTDKIVNKSRLSRSAIWGLFIVFILPLFLAFGLYATRSNWSLASTPNGELLNPPLHLTTDYKFDKRLWRVMYLTPECLKDVCELQQAKITSIKEATGKDFNRVDTVLAITTELPEGLYIMDPDNHIILKYPTNAPGKDILEDLRHLLKVSQIG